jgi:hypothetical protein
MNPAKISVILIVSLTIQYASYASCHANTRALYETDGHYWTVLVVATLLDLPDAKAIAYAAEYPDNVMNDDGYITRNRYTFLFPNAQTKVHALTGGNPDNEKMLSMYMLRNAQSANEKGRASHRLGDSFSHANDKKGKMYPHIIAHLFQWKKPDKIKSNPEKYLQYVLQLVEGLGGEGAEIDMTVFNYIAQANLTSDENAAILKAEYSHIVNSIAFNVEKDELPVVKAYLSWRLMPEAYAVHINTDKRGRTTSTIILTTHINTRITVRR